MMKWSLQSCRLLRVKNTYIPIVVWIVNRRKLAQWQYQITSSTVASPHTGFCTNRSWPSQRWSIQGGRRGSLLYFAGIHERPSLVAHIHFLPQSAHHRTYLLQAHLSPCKMSVVVAICLGTRMVNLVRSPFASNVSSKSTLSAAVLPGPFSFGPALGDESLSSCSETIQSLSGKYVLHNCVAPTQWWWRLWVSFSTYYWL